LSAFPSAFAERKVVSAEHDGRVDAAPSSWGGRAARCIHCRCWGPWGIYGRLACRPVLWLFFHLRPRYRPVPAESSKRFRTII